MTAQIPDTMEYEEEDYTLVGIEGSDLPTPQEFGMTPRVEPPLSLAIGSCQPAWTDHEQEHACRAQCLYYHMAEIDAARDRIDIAEDGGVAIDRPQPIADAITGQTRVFSAIREEQ